MNSFNKILSPHFDDNLHFIFTQIVCVYVCVCDEEEEKIAHKIGLTFHFHLGVLLPFHWILCK